MKNILKRVLVLILVLSAILSLGACTDGKPLLDLNKAGDNLTFNGYELEHLIGKDKTGEVGVTEILRATRTGVGDEDDEMLYITVYSSKKLARIEHDAVKAYLESQIKNAKIEAKKIEYLLQNHRAELTEDEISDYREELAELYDELEEMTDNIAVGRSGTAVWYGTEDAIEDTKRRQ